MSEKKESAWKAAVGDTRAYCGECYSLPCNCRRGMIDTLEDLAAFLEEHQMSLQVGCTDGSWWAHMTPRSPGKAFVSSDETLTRAIANVVHALTVHKAQGLYP
jgi:tRNA G46 methylase TrmB